MKRAFWHLYRRWCGLSLLLGFGCFLLTHPGGVFYKAEQFSRFVFRTAGWLRSTALALFRALAGFL